MALRRAAWSSSKGRLDDAVTSELDPGFSATVCMSLSPRPERLTSRILSLGRVGPVWRRRPGRGTTQGRDDALQAAGGRGRPEASASVIGTYSARPVSLSQACSGPTPG